MFFFMYTAVQHDSYVYVVCVV